MLCYDHAALAEERDPLRALLAEAAQQGLRVAALALSERWPIYMCVTHTHNDNTNNTNDNANNNNHDHDTTTTTTNNNNRNSNTTADENTAMVIRERRIGGYTLPFGAIG